MPALKLLTEHAGEQEPDRAGPVGAERGRERVQGRPQCGGGDADVEGAVQMRMELAILPGGGARSHDAELPARKVQTRSAQDPAVPAHDPPPTDRGVQLPHVAAGLIVTFAAT